MDKCPHCNGTSGYEYRVTIRGVQWNEWSGKGVNFENSTSGTSGGYHGVKRCVDCGKRIKEMEGGK